MQQGLWDYEKTLEGLCAGCGGPLWLQMSWGVAALVNKLSSEDTGFVLDELLGSDLSYVASSAICVGLGMR